MEERSHLEVEREIEVAERTKDQQHDLSQRDRQTDNG